MKATTPLLFALILLLNGCKKVNLNQFAFPSEQLDQYQYDDYSTPEISLPDVYRIQPDKRTLISISSESSETGLTHTLYGVYIGDLDRINIDTVILYLHGQSKHMDNYWTRASLLANIGKKHNYGVFMIDYRGYGRSEGVSTEIGLSEDTDAAINWLKSKGATSQKTIYYGYSLGAIPAIDRAAFRPDFKPMQLIIEAPLASVEYLVHQSTGLNVSPEFMTTLRFSNAEKIKAVNCPLLWLHGQTDTYVSIDNGELIFNSHQSNRKRAIKVPGSDHSEIPIKMGYPSYLSALHTFIRSLPQ